eukprot:2138532-Amphidinium_carterae.1
MVISDSSYLHHTSEQDEVSGPKSVFVIHDTCSVAATFMESPNFASPLEARTSSRKGLVWAMLLFVWCALKALGPTLALYAVAVLCASR